MSHEQAEHGTGSNNNSDKADLFAKLGDKINAAKDGLNSVQNLVMKEATALGKEFLNDGVPKPVERFTMYLILKNRGVDVAKNATLNELLQHFTPELKTGFNYDKDTQNLQLDLRTVVAGEVSRNYAITEGEAEQFGKFITQLAMEKDLGGKIDSPQKVFEAIKIAAERWASGQN